MAQLAFQYDFSFFEYWLSDYAGHGQDMEAAVGLLTERRRDAGGLAGRRGTTRRGSSC